MAHIDEGGQPIIKYINASQDHQFMVNSVLKMTEGVTPDVFNPPGLAKLLLRPTSEVV